MLFKSPGSFCGKNYSVVYHVGHYGFLWKFLVHKMTFFHDDRALFMIDTGTMSKSTYSFLIKSMDNLLQFGDFGLFNDLTYFCNPAIEGDLNQYICSFFDAFLGQSKEMITADSKIYSGFDARNAFGLYLVENNLRYAICDISHYVVYPNRHIFIKTDADKRYASAISKSKASDYTNPLVTHVIWSDNANLPEITKPGEFIDFNALLLNLLPDDKQIIINLYGLNLSLNPNRKTTIVACNSGGALVWKGLSKGDYFQHYRNVISLCGCDSDNIIVKCHPNYEFTKREFEEEFPGSIPMSGYIPAEIITTLSEFKISRMITSGGNSSKNDSIRIVDFSLDVFLYYGDTFLIYVLCALFKQYSGQVALFSDEKYSTFMSLLYGNVFGEKLCNSKDSPIAFAEKYSNVSGDYDVIVVLEKPEIGSSFSIYSYVLDVESPTTSHSSVFYVIVRNSVVFEFDSNIRTEFEYAHIHLHIWKVSDQEVDELVFKNECESRFYRMFLEFDQAGKVADAVHYLMMCSRTPRYELSLIDYLLKSGNQDDSNYALILLNKNGHQDQQYSIRLARFYRKKGKNNNLKLADYWYSNACAMNSGWIPEYVDFLLDSGNSNYFIAAYALCCERIDQLPSLNIKLARMFRDGKGVEKDLEKAIFYYDKAIATDISYTGEYADVLLRINDQSSFQYAFELCSKVSDYDAGSNIRLARMYRGGQFVNKDLLVSKRFFEIGINRGAAWAKNEYYDVLWSINNQTNDDLLYKMLQSEYMGGNHTVGPKLGRMYLSGRGTIANPSKAISLIRPVAADSPYWLVKLVDALLLSDNPEDNAEAFVICRGSKNQSADICLRLARMYRDGKGVGADKNEARSWYEKSADLGSKAAKVELTLL